MPMLPRLRPKWVLPLGSTGGYARSMTPLTLYTFGPYFGVPDPSPFVLKTITLMKMSGLPFVEDRGGFAKAPKGQAALHQ